jgi:hypothetical protein
MLVNDATRRDIAIKRLKDKSDFRVHLLIYLTINTMLVLIWAAAGGVTQTANGYAFGFFWPIFPIVGWGVGVVAHGYSVYFGGLYSEHEIQREMQKLPR